MAKRVNANLPDEIHRALRIALAEDETDFSTWLGWRIFDYLAEKGKVHVPKNQLTVRTEPFQWPPIKEGKALAPKTGKEATGKQTKGKGRKGKEA